MDVPMRRNAKEDEGMRRLLCGVLALMMLLAAGQALAETDFSAAFPDKFLTEGAEPIVTETSYQSHNIFIEITTQRYLQSDVYVADIYVRSMDHFTRYYAQNDWHKSKNAVPTMAKESSAILALTGDSSQNFRSGWVMGNGVVEREGSGKAQNNLRDICIVYRNGEVRPVKAPTIDQNDQVSEETDDIWHIFLFGPSLLDEEGKPYPNFKSVSPHEVQYANPRSVLGYYEPGHYCFVQVDGRQTSSALDKGKKNKGLTLEELSVLMESLGCKAAYNLDGGRSSMLWFGDGLISTPAAVNRQIGDILVISEGE